MSEEYKRAFESKDEFMKYYEEHKEEIDKLTTKQLNSVYKIKDCKISRNRKKLTVKQDIPKIEKPNVETNETVKEDTHTLAKSKEDKPKQVKTKQKEIKPQDLEKMINRIITEYEKQLTNLKELKNKLVSNDLFESEIPDEIQNETSN